ncbi:hypothetical protein [Streptomyces jumonjinensis]|uniref:Uncharacterized protein n=1 Tax=Streptomyces jumonjinensis TaxID=1945 RepID=A0A646KPM2_STRJU|nr:hypothetical protein [Streptomyces jumonjinensis]MQT03841.1 hypothetical protein [Streptomyces jumonjinensis]
MTAPVRPAVPVFARRGCRLKKKPPIRELTWWAYQGYRCFACDRPLRRGAVYCGWIRGRSGAHVLDVEVWSCP